MNEICRKCGYDIYFEHGTWWDSYDEDDLCYDDDLNLIGDGYHYPAIYG